jgi:hypothetical protein
MLDSASTKTLAYMSPPGLAEIRTRGLVLGYVQSGKTTNFTALISKAADAGYRLFVVLSGTTNVLRRQTQERLDLDLVDLNRESWISLTTLERDFSEVGTTNVNAFLTDHASQRTLCVIKKNSFRLGKLLRWLSGARPEVLSSCPVLVVDDEADQASLNSAARPGERTRINRQLIDLLTRLPKAAYVGYTATPFANVFVDPDAPEDLYPRDFIIDLPRPEGYFGPERLFGRDRLSLDDGDEQLDGEDMIRVVPATEAVTLSPSAATRSTFVPPIPPSLQDAISYFLLATAARRVRGQSDHSTMLVHTSGFIAVHRSFVQPLEDFIARLGRGVVTADATALQGLRAQWTEESRRVPPEPNTSIVTFDAILNALPSVFEDTEVVVENSWSERRLNYDGPKKTHVVLGGNVLSRGLTLKGLVVSYFIRNASAYDTLLQMGRWFGYRPGYADLPRVWMTDELRGYFYDLATVEQEIRYDVARYERDGLKPIDFAVRIRTHPQLSITSRLKMQHAVACSMSYSGRQVQTIQFRHRDIGWVERNAGAVRNLISRGLREKAAVDDRDGRWCLRGLPVELIFMFLEEYRPHPSSISLRADLLAGYIRSQVAESELTRWNVCILGQSRDSVGTIDLGLSSRVNLLNRSKFNRPLLDAETADLKAVLSKADLIADFDVTEESYRELSNLTHDQLVRERTSRLPGVGLLTLYPISKSSAPRVPTDSRKPLEAVDDLLAAAWIFPEARRSTPQTYMSVDLSGLTRDEADWESDE